MIVTVWSGNDFTFVYPNHSSVSNCLLFLFHMLIFWLRLPCPGVVYVFISVSLRVASADYDLRGVHLNLPIKKRWSTFMLVLLKLWITYATLLDTAKASSPTCLSRY